jgi:hypothetical protein
VALAGEPYNIKPVAFLAIVAGIVGGPIPGFAVGWLSMTVSDLYLGAGIWTIETSAWMAIVGLGGALLWHKAARLSRWKMALGGFLLTMLFDVGTSITGTILFPYPWEAAILSLYVPFISGGVSPWPFGLAHELTTAILLGAIGSSLIVRVRKVYQ